MFVEWLASLVERLSALVVAPVFVAALVFVLPGFSALVSALVPALVSAVALPVATLVLVLPGFSALFVERLSSLISSLMSSLMSSLVSSLVSTLLAEWLALALLLGFFLGFWSSLGSGFFFFLIFTIIFFEVIIEVLIFFELFIELVLINVLVIKVLITLLSSRSGHLRCSLLSGLRLLLSGLRLLLRRLRFLLGWGSSLNGRSLVLLRGSFGCRFDFLALLILILTLDLLLPEQVALLVRFEETGDVEGAIAFDRESDLVKQGDEDVDWELGFVFGEAGNEELIGVLLEPEGSRSRSVGSKDDVGEGEDLALGFLCLGGTELVALTLL